MDIVLARGQRTGMVAASSPDTPLGAVAYYRFEVILSEALPIDPGASIENVMLGIGRWQSPKSSTSQYSAVIPRGARSLCKSDHEVLD
jgi:hypothetical protein